LRSVLETRIEREDLQRGGGGADSTQKSVIIVQKAPRRGYFDLLLQTAVRVGRSSPPKKTLFAWNGNVTAPTR
jgi:hypothetical protein